MLWSKTEALRSLLILQEKPCFLPFPIARCCGLNVSLEFMCWKCSPLSCMLVTFENRTLGRSMGSGARPGRHSFTEVCLTQGSKSSRSYKAYKYILTYKGKNKKADFSRLHLYYEPQAGRALHKSVEDNPCGSVDPR